MYNLCAESQTARDLAEPSRQVDAPSKQYRRLSPEQRADHVEALFLLGRLVDRLPQATFMWRSFFILNASGRLR